MNEQLKLNSDDHLLIEKLQRLLRKDSKTDVLREALKLLEAKAESEADRENKIERYKKAAKLMANDPSSREIWSIISGTDD